MRKILITLATLVLTVAEILGTWIFLARQVSRLVDRFRTIEIASVLIHSVTYEASGTQLLWKKAAGANLQMLWRYEQFFYPGSGWGSGFMTREGTTGLIMVDIKE